MFELTIFRNTYDNKTDRTMDFDTWPEFKLLLRGLSKQPGEKGGPNSSPLISPSLYEPDSTRSNDNVSHWGSWSAVDVDDLDIGKDLEDKLKELCGQYEYFCYSTASSRFNQPKFRLVFPLTATLYRDDLPHFWYALNKQLGEIGDQQTKDLSRMYYVPAQYPNAYNFTFENSGDMIDPAELMAKHAFIKPAAGFYDNLPKGIRDGLVEHAKSKLKNTEYMWSSYTNCPFVNQKKIASYKMINNAGWYYSMYSLMVSIAGNAISKGYPITPFEIELLLRELDADTGGWYTNRPIIKEATRAVQYVMGKNL